MENKENRTCAFNECLAYHDGKEIHYFYGKHPGELSDKMQGMETKEKWSRSLNGTYVNSEKVTEEGYKIVPGDIISIGDVKLRVEAY